MPWGGTSTKPVLTRHGTKSRGVLDRIKKDSARSTAEIKLIRFRRTEIRAFDVPRADESKIPNLFNSSKVNAEDINRDLNCALKLRKVPGNLFERQTAFPVLAEFCFHLLLECLGCCHINSQINLIQG